MTFTPGADSPLPPYGSVADMGMDEWRQEELDTLLQAVIEGVPGIGAEGQVLRVSRGRLRWSDVHELPTGADGTVVRFAGGQPHAAPLVDLLPKLPARTDVPASNQAQVATPGLVSLTVVTGLVGVVNGLLTNQEALRRTVNELRADLKARGYMEPK